MENLDMYWSAVDERSREKTSWTRTDVKPRECGPEDIGQEQYDTGLLFFCPPLDMLSLEGSYYA